MKIITKKMIALFLFLTMVISEISTVFAYEIQDVNVDNNEVQMASGNLFNEKELKMNVGEEYAIDSLIDSSISVENLDFISADEKIIKVENKKITALKEGITKLYLDSDSNDKECIDTCLINVSPKIELFSNEYDVKNLKNEYVSVVASNDHFSMGTQGGNPQLSTDDNKRILFGWDNLEETSFDWDDPEISPGWYDSGTSYATIVIDDSPVIYASTPQLNSNDKTIYGTMSKNNVTINRRISIVQSPTSGRDDIVEFTYEAVNNDTVAHNVGGRIVFDTMLGSNDSSPFRIPGIGSVTTQMELVGNEIPQYWQGFDDLSNPTIISQGTLYRTLSQRPDKVQFGNYSVLCGNIWESNQNIGSDNMDSAVAMTWYPVSLNGGETKTFTTYYGISEMSQEQSSQLELSITGDTDALVNNANKEYNSITVTAYIKNAGVETEDNVTISLETDSDIDLCDGYSKSINIGSMSANEERQVSWMINPKASDEETNYQYRVMVTSDRREDVSISKTIHIPILDIVPPSKPTLSVESISSQSVILKWTNSTDKNGISCYKLYINDKETFSGNENRKRITGLETDKEYSCTAYAVDSYGNISDKSTLVFKTVLPRINSFFINDINGKIGGNNSAILYATIVNNNNLPGTEMRFFYGNDNTSWNLIAQDDIPKENYIASWDFKNVLSGIYFLKAQIIDSDGNEDEKIITTTLDNTPPNSINNFNITPQELKLLLSWEMANEIDVKKYRIYRGENGTDFSVYKELDDRKLTYFTDTNVETGKLYYYKIGAVDELGNESDPSPIIAKSPLADEVLPQIMAITPQNGSVLSGTKTISVSANDNISVSSIELQYSLDNGATYSTFDKENDITRADFSFNTKNISEKSVMIRAIAVDSSGNVSDGLPVYTYIIDNDGPEKITGFKVNDKTYTSVTVAWNEISASDYSYCVVEKKIGDSWYQCATVTSVLGAYINNLLPNTNYTFRTVAYDKYGNRGIESDELVVTTKADTDAPVITSIYPKSTSFSSNFTVQITAVDLYLVKSLDIEVSTDAENWSKEDTITLDKPISSKTFVYTLDISDKEDGILYVRGVATDTSGNISDTSSKAPFVQYNIDTDAPEMPSELKMLCFGGYLELQWKKGYESDLNGYDIYRATSENGAYTKIASCIQKINYIDSDVSIENTYYYKIKAIDTAGNVSDFTSVVSGKMLDDLVAPEIKSWNYVNFSTLKKSNTINILATDNNRLREMVLEYKKADGSWNVLENQASFQNNNVFKFSPEKLSDGTYVFRAKASDYSGNESPYSSEYTYTFDSIAPQINNVVLTPNEGNVSLAWNGENENDLAGYYVYRKISNSYIKVASYSKNQENKYVFTDTDVVNGTNYTYKIEAFDTVGNKTTYISNSVTPLYVPIEPQPDLSKPNISCTIPSTMKQNVEEYFDATPSTDNVAIQSYLWDFGDGASSSIPKSIHSYSEIGEYTVTLTVTDTSGNSSVASKKVTVVEKKQLGTLRIKVVDDSGNRVAGVGVFYRLGSEDMISYSTNSNGEVTITDCSGTYDIGIYSDGYLPAKETSTIVNNAETNITIRIIKKEIIVGELTYTRMTFEEIQSAGIDPYAPENQYVYKYEINLTFGTSNYTGTAIKSGNNNSSNVQPVKITNWEKSSESTISGDTTLKEGYVWIIGDDSQRDEGYNETYVSTSKQIVAVLEIPGETSWLKEFFDVQLHIHNQADSDFVIDDCKTTLNYPDDGLTLMTGTAEKYSQNKTVDIGSIAGQEHKYINWILRGDKPGEYNISADFSGTLREFNEQINAKFGCAKPISVLGTDGLKIYCNVEDTIDDGYVYFNMGFANESEQSIHLFDFNINGIEPYKLFLQQQDGKLSEINEELTNKTILPGEIFWKYYSTDINTFATYINPNISIESDSEAVGSMLTEACYKLIEGLEIPIVFNAIGTKKMVTARFESQGLDSTTATILPAEDGNKDRGIWTVEYTDSFFRNDSNKFNLALARFSLAAQLSCWSSRNDTLGNAESLENYDNTTRKYAQNIANVYSTLDFENADYYHYDVNISDGIRDTVAHSIAHKKIIVAGEEKMLIAVMLRGGGYGTEWGSNFKIGEPNMPYIMDKYHYAWEMCADDVIGNIHDYIKSNNIPDNAKIWITGYSRSAAVADIVAGKLNKEHYEKTGEKQSNNIYAYTFATPQGVNQLEGASTRYDNIFNIVNSSDVIPDVALSKLGWNFGRYGITKNLPSCLTNSDYVSLFYKTGITYKQIRKNEGIDDDLDFYVDPFQELSKAELLKYVGEAIPTAAQYVNGAQNTLVPLIGNKLGGGNADLNINPFLETIKIAAFNVDDVGIALKNLVKSISTPIGQLQTAGLASYVLYGVGTNHYPETYIAWLSGHGTTDLFKGNSYKVAQIVLSKGYTLMDVESSDINIKEYDIKVITNDGDVVLSVVNGEFLVQNIPVTIQNGICKLYLPGDNNYIVQITPKKAGLIEYSVSEYTDNELQRVVAKSNIPANADENISCSIPEQEDSSINEYVIKRDGALIDDTNITISDVDSNEIEYVSVACNTEGTGYVVGAGDIIKGEYVNVVATEVEENTFEGWYAGDLLVSTEKNYLFKAVEDIALTAKFKEVNYTASFVNNSGLTGVAPDSIITDYVEKIILPTNTFVNDGYKFAGWQAEVNGEKIFLPENAEYVVMSDVEFSPVWVGIEMLVGASVRLLDPSGLRFYTQVDTDSYNVVKALDPDVKCGTLICPLDYLSGFDFTIKELNDNNKKYLDIENQAFADENPLFKEFRGVISNVKEKNYNRLFAGRGYIEYKYSNGVVNTIYTDFNQNDNARMISDVAKKALLDINASYTNEQKEILNIFIK